MNVKLILVIFSRDSTKIYRVGWICRHHEFPAWILLSELKNPNSRDILSPIHASDYL